MEKKLIYFNEQNYNAEVSNLENLKSRCQAIIDKFNSLKIGEFESKDFEKLLFSTESFLFEKTMVGKPLEVAGMKLSKQKLYDLVEKPSGYFELENMTGSLVKMIENRIRLQQLNKTVKDYLLIFEFDNSGDLIVKNSILQYVRAENEVYALKETTQKLHYFAERFSTLLNESDVFFKVRAGMGIARFGEFLDEIIEVDFVTKKASIKLDAVKSYDYQ